MLTLKINKPICFIFIDNSIVKTFACMFKVPDSISNIILTYLPKYVIRVCINDLYLSPILENIGDVKQCIYVKKTTVFNGYSDAVIKTILEYMMLYPKFTIETEKIPRNFKNRNLDTLLIKSEFEIFNRYLDICNIKHNVEFTSSVMRLALSLKLPILAEKCGAIIAMFIKDKPLSLIEKILCLRY